MPRPSIVSIVAGRPVIAVGALRHKITIRQFGPASPPITDAAGVANSWNVFTTAQAGIDQVRGVDVIRGGQTVTQLFLTVVLWWQAGVTPNMQVEMASGIVYVIQSVENPLEMNVALILNCIGIGANQ